MRLWSGAIALGLLMGLPISGTSRTIAIELSKVQAPDSELAQVSQDEQGTEADRLLNQGQQQFRRGQIQGAFQSWQTALRLYREAGDRQGEAFVLGNLGIAYRFLGQYERAIDFHEQSLKIKRDIGDRRGEANSLGSLGNVYHSQGQYERAIDFHNQALAIERDLGERQGEAASLGNLGNAYYSLGQYKRAIETHNQSLAISRNLGDRRSEAASLGSLGIVYRFLGQHERSIELYNQSLVISRDIGDRRGEANSLGNLGWAYYSLDQYERAIDTYNQSLAITREIGDIRGFAATLGNLGTAYQSLGQYQRAIELHKRYQVLSNAIGDRRGEATALGNLGAVHLFSGEYERAIEFHNQSLNISREIGDRQGEVKWLNSLGLAHGSLGQYQQAESLLRHSLTVAEALEGELGANDRDRISFFETIALTYSSLTRLFLVQDKADFALEIADRSRARSLVQFLNPSTGNQSGSSLNIDQIKHLAREKNATLIIYAVVVKDLYIWVVSPTGQINLAKANPEAAGLPLSRASRDIRGAATFGTFNNQIFGQDKYRINLQALRGDGTAPLWAGSPEYLERGYKLLIQPIEEYLPKDEGSRLIIVPHRELGTVPFTALFDDSNRFLIDRYTITVTPSLQILHTLQQKIPTAKGAPLVVGNPSPMPDQLSPLPGSEAEATAIAQKLNTVPILGNQATEATIKSKLSNASILHFATHGVIPKSDRDLNSWLALANTSGGNEDNKLTISEIFNSQLNAQLAVLSACNTNSGEVSGEGVLGLARAFLKAGVPTVIASSWKVPDRETQILMDAFYEQLLAGKTYAEALRIAQLKIRADSPNPFAWAAFTVIGEGDRTLELP
ncbi:MAG: CHAT domain-containing tetratricopeptide repeat protein [Cyanobacteria bacterium P01_F01_bin.153]